jgi:signal transduction histidine kinase
MLHVEALGGSISVRNLPKGCVFSITLPRKKV